MRLLRTSIATAAAVAITGTAFAATTTSVTRSMGGTARLQAGGQLTLTISRKSSSSTKFHVRINYNVQVRSSTVLAFAAFPCRSTRCTGASLTTIRLGAGHRRVKFDGAVPVRRTQSGGKTTHLACVFAQMRDRGPSNKPPGTIVRNGKSAGVTLCQNVGAGP
jgi:hypothetical protein